MRETDWKIELVFKIGIFSPEKALKVVNLSDWRWKTNSWSRNSFWIKLGGSLVNEEVLINQIKEHQTWHGENRNKAVFGGQYPEHWINDNLEPKNKALVGWIKLLGLFKSKNKVSHVANWETEEIDQEQGLFPLLAEIKDISEPLEIKDTPTFQSPQENVGIDHNWDDGDEATSKELDDIENVPEWKVNVSTAVTLTSTVITISSFTGFLSNDKAILGRILVEVHKLEHSFGYHAH